MQETDMGRPSEFALLHGKAIASRGSSVVGLDSRITVDLVGPGYADTLRQHARGKLHELGFGSILPFLRNRGLDTDSVRADQFGTDGPAPCDCFRSCHRWLTFHMVALWQTTTFRAGTVFCCTGREATWFSISSQTRKRKEHR